MVRVRFTTSMFQNVLSWEQESLERQHKQSDKIQNIKDPLSLCVPVVLVDFPSETRLFIQQTYEILRSCRVSGRMWKQ